MQTNTVFYILEKFSKKVYHKPKTKQISISTFEQISHDRLKDLCEGHKILTRTGYVQKINCISLTTLSNVKKKAQF